MERTILLVAIFAVIGLGLFAGGGVLVGLSNTGPQPSDYVLANGECWVHPQGDPLYDEHYANKVNPQNCQAYETQEKANNIKADTRRVNVETNNMVTAVYSIFGVVVIILALITFAIIRG